MLIRNYFRIAWRIISRHKLNSSINIGGLAVGIAVSLILFLYVYNEFSFDKFHSKYDRLYQVVTNFKTDKGIVTDHFTSVPLAPALVKDFPEIENAARSATKYSLLSVDDNGIKRAGRFVDPAFLELFSFQFIRGNPSTALSETNSIVLTASTAQALFGKEDPINRLVAFDGKESLKVTAVVDDIPKNSTIQFNYLTAWKLFEKTKPWIKKSGWDNYGFITYASLKPSASYATVDKKIRTIAATYDPENDGIEMFLYPINRWHLYNDFENGKIAGGRISFVRLFFYLALGILVLACINFMNLATARSAKRAREVGVRKAMGATRSTLISHFLGESMIMALAAFLIAVVLAIVTLPYFNKMAGVFIEVPLSHPQFWIIAITGVLLTGLFAGSYPSLFLSGFKPIKVLQGLKVPVRSGVKLRQVLVVTQFAFSVALILSTLIIYRQVNEIKNRPVGYSQQGLVEIQLEGQLSKKFDRFRKEAIETGAVTDGCISSASITEVSSSSWNIKWPGQRPDQEKIPVHEMGTTWNFSSTYNITITKGRDFSPSHPADSQGVLLNESAVALMQLKDPVGQIIRWQDQDRTIVGVFRDVVQESPFEPTQPLIVGFAPDWHSRITVRLNPEHSAGQNLAQLEKLYKQYNPEYPFNYNFVSDEFAVKFQSENLLVSLSGWFATLAVFIACLGLFGLTAFAAEQRTREIGIRKVLGAGTLRLWMHLSREFLLLILLSLLIGIPAAWYYLHDWLMQYTYHVSISAGLMLVTSGMALLIALLTISMHTVKAALTNPVKSLRTE